MKIRGISLDTVNKQASIYANYTPGDVETLENLNPEDDYVLMPTKEVQALVSVVEDNICGDVNCNCDECEYLENCNGCDGCVEEYPEPLFGGAYYDTEGNFIYIEKVIYNAPKTIVFWNDGTKTSSTCGEHDSYNPEMGLALAVLKKITSNEFTVRTLHDWVPANKAGGMVTKETVTLKEVRKSHRN